MKLFKKNYDLTKNLQLIISSILIMLVALAYGINPNKILSALFDFSVETTDLKLVFRAMMGLYLGMVIIWTVGIIKPKFWTTATIINVVFMGGLASGRIISLLIDGLPTIYFSIGLIIEIALAFWGLRNIKYYGLNLLD